MKKIQILLVSMASASAAFAIDIDIKPGELERLIDEKVITEKSLVMKGAIDARDLAAMEHLPAGVINLDMSNVNIEKLTLSTKKYFGKTLFAAGELPGYTFFKSGLETLSLPAGVKTIGEGAFSASSLKEIVIPDGVESIGDYAFYGCDDLESVTLPSTLKALGKGAFGNCHKLKKVIFSGSQLSELPEKTFAGCVELGNIKLPSSLVKIGKEAFTLTQIRELDLSNIKEFDVYALSGMPYLETLTINPAVAEVNGLLMDDISLISLTGVPANLPDYFSANCNSLDTNDLIRSVSTVGKYSLANQEEATEVFLSPGITSLDRGAISGNALSSIDVTELRGEVPSVGPTTFEGIDQKSVSLIIHDDYFDTWANASHWKDFMLKKASATVVNPVEAGGNEDIFISLNGGTLNIESGFTLNDVKVFSTDGQLLYSVNPNDQRIGIPTDIFTSGIIIVRATNEKNSIKSATVMMK